MSESQDVTSNKLEYWQDQVTKWKASGLTQPSFCKQSGITLSTFVYWRCQLLKQKNKNTSFAAVKIVKDNSSDLQIQIRLVTGHVIFFPVAIGSHEIARLIHEMGLLHA